MDRTVRERYASLRKEGASAWSAHAAAKEKPSKRLPLNFKPGSGYGMVLEVARLRRGPWRARVEIVPDYHADISYLGEFTSTWEPGAVTRCNAQREECKYFVPSITYDEHRDGLRALGFSRHDAHRLARKNVAEDLDRAERFGYDWHHIGIRVVVSRKGVNLGEASVWGVESDAGDDHRDEIVRYCLYEALAEARETLKDLTKEA